ncbi:MAG: hypothetical protein Q4G16_06085 [Cruoricaptor ignavus]|nr:hypothetical protein [Cruoricaptor ignavus]
MKTLFSCIFAMLVLSSCSTIIMNKSVQPSDVKDIGSFKTNPIIRIIEKGNVTIPSDSLSIVSGRILDSIILNTPNPKIKKMFEIEDEDAALLVRRDLLEIMAKIKETRKIENIKTTPLMDSIVKSQNQKYGLFVVSIGFERAKGNYGKQTMKGLGVGLLTLGTYVAVPLKSNTALYAMIYDAENSSIVFYNHIPIVEKSPTDEKNLRHLYNKLFDGYFYKIKQ